MTHIPMPFHDLVGSFAVLRWDGVNVGTGERCMRADSSTVTVCVVGRFFVCVLSVDYYFVLNELMVAQPLAYCLTFSVCSDYKSSVSWGS